MSGLRKMARGALRRVVNRYAPPEVATAIRFLRSSGTPAFPKRNRVVERDVPSTDVLVLSPHPDDEAIGMGGCLVKHVENGSRVTVLYLTDGAGVGDEASRRELRAVRRAESEALGESLGLRQVFWDRPDTGLTNDQATVAAMVEILSDVRPELVYLPAIFDQHYDHFTANQVFADALGRTDLAPTVCGYEVWDVIPFPNLYVDVSAQEEAKERALGHYATPLRTTDFPKLCRYRASVHYTLHVDSRIELADKGFAEAFLRFDGATYCELLAAYVRALRADGAELPSHLQPEPAVAGGAR